jgi:hypothetical protein
VYRLCHVAIGRPVCLNIADRADRDSDDGIGVVDQLIGTAFETIIEKIRLNASTRDLCVPASSIALFEGFINFA